MNCLSLYRSGVLLEWTCLVVEQKMVAQLLVQAVYSTQKVLVTRKKEKRTCNMILRCPWFGLEVVHTLVAKSQWWMRTTLRIF